MSFIFFLYNDSIPFIAHDRKIYYVLGIRSLILMSQSRSRVARPKFGHPALSSDTLP